MAVFAVVNPEPVTAAGSPVAPEPGVTSMAAWGEHAQARAAALSTTTAIPRRIVAIRRDVILIENSLTERLGRHVESLRYDVT